MASTIDLYAGPRGWSQGLRRLGRHDVGLELDASACATAVAAGHPTIRTDVAAYPIGHLVGRVEGLIASPPCQSFSAAGKGDGRAQIREICAAVRAGRWDLGSREEGYGHVMEVGRWAETLGPAWVACEQVPPVLPVWRAYAERWRALGWSAWAGILNAADFGVPQTRQRAFLIARPDGRLVRPPEPTHSRGGNSLFGDLDPWVSMAEALGWLGEDDPARTLCGDRSPRWMYGDPDGTRGRMVGFPRRETPEGGYRERDMRSEGEPAFTVTEKARSWTVNTGRDWKPGGTREDAQTIDAEQNPAPTLTGKSGEQWHLRQAQRGYGDVVRTADEPAPTLALGHDAASWAWERPATTVCGVDQVWPPGHKINGDDIRRLGEEEARRRYGVRATGREGSVRLTIEDALILQGFPSDYPVQGTKTKQFEQVGNAVPPPLAEAVLRAVIG